MLHGKDTIFVRHAMPGEQVRVRIGKPLRDGWSASLDTVIKAHPHRIEPHVRSMRDAEAVSSCILTHRVSSSGKKNRS